MKKIILLSLLLTNVIICISQNSTCGFKINDKSFALKDFDKNISAYNNLESTNFRSTITIPVVVHIVWNLSALYLYVCRKRTRLIRSPDRIVVFCGLRPLLNEQTKQPFALF